MAFLTNIRKVSEHEYLLYLLYIFIALSLLIIIPLIPLLDSPLPTVYNTGGNFWVQSGPKVPGCLPIGEVGEIKISILKIIFTKYNVVYEVINLKTTTPS